MTKRKPVAECRYADYVKVRWGGLALAAVVLAIDFVSKAWVLGATASGRLPWWLVDGQVGMRFAWNRGMSFSLMDGWVYGPWILGVVAVLACGWFVHWLGERGWGWHQAGLGLLIGGALGNLVDRVQHGAVVDFILINPWGLFPYTFNPADSAITVGVALLLLDSFLRRA